MSAVNPEKSYSRSFLMVTCPCGKSLRARVDQAGSEICCWSCRRMVPVPLPRSFPKTWNALSRGWAEVFDWGSLGVLVLAAAALTALLAVPRAGIVLATIGLVAGAYGYSELIRRGGDPAESAPVAAPELGLEAEEVDEREPRSRFAARCVLAAIFGLALIAPILLASGGAGRPVRLSGLTLVVLPLVLIVLPVALTAVSARDRQGPVPWRHLSMTFRRHPFAVVSALAVVPIAAVVAESLIFGISYFYSMLAFLQLDLMPRPLEHLEMFKMSPLVGYGFADRPEGPITEMYFHHLREGYTLFGAITPSLPVPKPLIYCRWSATMDGLVYYLVRAGLTLGGAIVMVVALALQARWLGLIAGLAPRQSAAKAPATGPDEVTLTG